jgi:hypothetical protein
MKEINTSDVNEVYNEVFRLMIRLCRDYDPLAVSGVMLAQSLRLYKTILSEEEYESMCDSIKDSMTRVEKYEDKTLH